MAILGKITAEVLVDGQALQEYEDDGIENENPDLVVKYIEATSGANFHIRVSILDSFKITSDAVSLEVYLDGNNVENVTPYNHQISKPDSPFCYLFRGSETKGDEGWSRQAFLFSEITRIQESSTPQSKPMTAHLDKIGIIALKVYRVHGLGIDVANKPSYEQESLGKVTGLTEKSLKGIDLSHSARLGKKQSCITPTNWQSSYTDGEEFPIAAFIFTYRSRATLQSMLLIPRTSSPVPLEDRPVTDLSLEEARELLMRQRTRTKTEANTGPKREEQIKPEHGIKRERDESTRSS